MKEKKTRTGDLSGKRKKKNKRFYFNADSERLGTFMERYNVRHNRNNAKREKKTIFLQCFPIHLFPFIAIFFLGIEKKEKKEKLF